MLLKALPAACFPRPIRTSAFQIIIVLRQISFLFLRYFRQVFSLSTPKRLCLVVFGKSIAFGELGPFNLFNRFIYFVYKPLYFVKKLVKSLVTFSLFTHDNLHNIV